MWKAFKVFGRLVDICIARKKTGMADDLASLGFLILKTSASLKPETRSQSDESLRLRCVIIKPQWLKSVVTKIVDTKNIRMFKEKEGIQDVLTYIGGLFVQLQFESQELAMDFKEKADKKLNALFRSLTEWVPLFYVKEILARTSVIGLPPQYWSRKVVEKTVIT
ncbi:hypothetical protein L2E82_38946 [Cichorium intybus]|uniref:Uncharacterized protein n=1 Tax=Cichorium intybus TaxID=13427 RepID=A0ACB9AGB0_CICIN|nr:hypothetical protein L2E82_38946 [Cichorium intybus]